MDFIYNDVARMFGGGFITAMGVTLILIIIVITIAYFVSKPFDDLLKRINKENYKPQDDEIAACLKIYKNLNKLTISSAVIGFVFGQLIMIINGVKTGRYDNNLNRFTVIMLQNISFGLVAAISEINGLDYILSPFREKLHIRSLNNFKKQKSFSMSAKLALTVSICIYFMGINMFSVLYGLMVCGPEYAGLFMNKGLLCLILSFLCVAYPVYVVIHALKRRMKLTTEAMTDISYRSDLSKRIDITVMDDFGDLTTSINYTMHTFSKMIKELTGTTDTVSKSADVITTSAVSAKEDLNIMTSTLSKISDNSSKQNDLIIEAEKNILELAESVENVKRRVSEQSNSVQNISSSVTEMTANIASVTQTARKAQVTSDELTTTSASGRQSIENAISTMKSIQEASDQVQEIVQVIQDIAEQTNLLSMNAAIEAAHAGSIGQGFAVVADEVRSLAESSSQSAQDIQNIIVDMVNKISNGVDAINSAGTSFNEIADKVQNNAQYVNSIFAAMEEQNIGAEETQRSTLEVVEAVQAVDKLTDEEAVSAKNIRDFMSVVVDASQSTINAVNDTVIATENLQHSVESVATVANENKESVSIIHNQVRHFKISNR